jgi:hypothetical protein
LEGKRGGEPAFAYQAQSLFEIFSVSPGKPTMMSVVIAASGIAARTFSMIDR